ncbi:MAG: DNA polymerase III subunit gamma/tau [Rikenellaceae bacterium]
MEQFVVSARKYRPQTFASVVGQSHITNTLKNAIERGQLAHAYLFCGPRGVGKTTCARIFAKTINCLNPKGNEACGVCESCIGFADGRSMNIHELDAASNNSVEDIRSLIEQVRIIPQVGKYALFIIDEVHMLSTAAFNAFLKTLEEPPAHAIFILATTERHKILPTILSRCQCYDFNRIRVEDGAEYLRYIAQSESVTIDDDSLNLIAQKADGGMRDALSMFDKAVSFGGNNLDFKVVAQTLGVVDYDTYFRVTDQLLAANYGAALVTFDGVLGMGFGASSFLTGLNKHLRDLLVAREESTKYLMELTGAMMERYADQGRRCSVEFLFGAITVLTNIDGELKRSSNQRLLVELGLMKISGLGQKKNVGACDFSDVEVKLPPLEPNLQQPPQQHVVQQVAVKESPKPVEPPKVVEAAPTPKPAKKPAPKPAPKPLPKPLFSLSGALKDNDVKSSETSATEAVVTRVIDPETEQKLNEAKSRIISYLEAWRPRFKAFFEGMKIEGCKIHIEVPTEELSLEIRRGETELLTEVVRIAGVNGAVELDVVVNEEVVVKRPIKLEDRIAHFSKLNPLIVELTKALDMQVDG